MSGFERVVVVGAGLIGGSLARRLDAIGRHVTVVDPDPVTIRAAGDAGLDVATDVPAEADLVVLATPLDLLPGTFAAVAGAAPRAVVVDLGSVKRAPAEAAAAAALGDRYVGCHPMAGTEHSGFAHSDERLLVGATWAVTHGSGTSETARVVEWAATDFDATVVVLAADAHDRTVALVSHAPHAVAHALLAVTERSSAPSLAGTLAAGSFRDGTRVAGRNAARTFNMLAENAAALAPVLDDLVAELTALRADLDRPEALLARLEAVARADAAVRAPDLAFAPCPSLAAALEASRASGEPIAVRRRGEVIETAGVSSPTPGRPVS